MAGWNVSGVDKNYKEIKIQGIAGNSHEPMKIHQNNERANHLAYEISHFSKGFFSQGVRDFWFLIGISRDF